METPHSLGCDFGGYKTLNANILIAQRWLGMCCLNLVACIQHVVAKVFTNVEALGDA